MNTKVIAKMQKEHDAIQAWMDDHYEVPYYIYLACWQKVQDLEASIGYQKVLMRRIAEREAVEDRTVM